MPVPVAFACAYKHDLSSDSFRKSFVDPGLASMMARLEHLHRTDMRLVHHRAHLDGLGIAR